MEYYHQAEKKKVYTIASILDPRIKLHFFKCHENVSFYVILYILRIKWDNNRILFWQTNFRAIKKTFFDEAEKYNQHKDDIRASEAGVASGSLPKESDDWLDSIFQGKKASNLELK